MPIIRNSHRTPLATLLAAVYEPPKNDPLRASPPGQDDWTPVSRLGRFDPPREAITQPRFESAGIVDLLAQPRGVFGQETSPLHRIGPWTLRGDDGPSRRHANSLSVARMLIPKLRHFQDVQSGVSARYLWVITR